MRPESPARVRHWVLRFISGKYLGSEVALRAGKEITIGRSDDTDIVLVEDNVSRRHAAIVARDGEVSIVDLGSTNGTYVNGEKIHRGRLLEGDKILVGTSIMMLAMASRARAPTAPGRGGRGADRATSEGQLEPTEPSASFARNGGRPPD